MYSQNYIHFLFRKCNALQSKPFIYILQLWTLEWNEIYWVRVRYLIAKVGHLKINFFLESWYQVEKEPAADQQILSQHVKGHFFQYDRRMMHIVWKRFSNIEKYYLNNLPLSSYVQSPSNLLFHQRKTSLLLKRNFLRLLLCDNSHCLSSIIMVRASRISGGLWIKTFAVKLKHVKKHTYGDCEHRGRDGVRELVGFRTSNCPAGCVFGQELREGLPQVPHILRHITWSDLPNVARCDNRER